MNPGDLHELKEKQFLTEKQFSTLSSIYSGERISVYYDLRIVLYLGVMLFSTGVGILVYKNIGDIGHLLSIIALFILAGICFYYSIRFAPRYSNQKTTGPTPYYDYIVLLFCLLFISLLGYLQFQYELFDEGMGETTLVTTVLFVYCAYRFDHLGVLSLAITAFASFWSISISPQSWYEGNFSETANLHNTAIIFGAVLATVAILLDRKNIKPHFTFTYVNFASLIYLGGSISGLFIDEGWSLLYAIAVYAGCAATAWYAHTEKSFLFLLYAFIAAYIATTYLLTYVLPDDVLVWSFYMIISCGGFIAFIIRYKNYFKRSA